MTEDEKNHAALMAETTATQSVLVALMGRLISAGLAPRVLIEQTFEEAADVAVSTSMQSNTPFEKEVAQRMVSTIEELRAAVLRH